MALHNPAMEEITSNFLETVKEVCNGYQSRDRVNLIHLMSGISSYVFSSVPGKIRLPEPIEDAPSAGVLQEFLRKAQSRRTSLFSGKPGKKAKAKKPKVSSPKRLGKGRAFRDWVSLAFAPLSKAKRLERKERKLG
jgi:hypothetical protein